MSSTRSDHRPPDGPVDTTGGIDRHAEVADQERSQRVFSTSVAISAVRCLLTYVIFPFIAPIVGIASGVGSTVGIVTSVVGIGANVWSIRRFHASGHPWRWPITAINVGIIGLLLVLLVLDIANLSG